MSYYSVCCLARLNNPILFKKLSKYYESFLVDKFQLCISFKLIKIIKVFPFDVAIAKQMELQMLS